MLFDVATERVGEWSRLRVVGDVDLASLPSLRSALDAVDSPSVVVDLDSVGVLEPIALGALHAAALRCSRRSGRFVVACPPGAARDLLAELGLDSVWEVVAAADDVTGA